MHANEKWPDWAGRPYAEQATPLTNRPSRADSIRGSALGPRRPELAAGTGRFAAGGPKPGRLGSRRGSLGRGAAAGHGDRRSVGIQQPDVDQHLRQGLGHTLLLDMLRLDVLHEPHGLVDVAVPKTEGEFEQVPNRTGLARGNRVAASFIDARDAFLQG